MDTSDKEKAVSHHQQCYQRWKEAEMVKGVDLGVLVNNVSFSDVSFVVGEEGERIYAHRAILSARSDVFCRMFEGKFKESNCDPHAPISIPNISPFAFEQLLNYIYTGNFCFDLVNVVSVYAAADQYLIEGLKELCSCRITDHLTPNNVLPLLEQTMACGQDPITDRCLEFLGEWAEEVLDTETWTEVPFENALRIVTSDLLSLSEFKLLLAVLRWGWQVLSNINCSLPASLALKRGGPSLLKPTDTTSPTPERSPSAPPSSSPGAIFLPNISSLTEQLKTLLGHIRLPLLSPCDLHEVVHPLCDAGLISFHSLLEAYRYHVDPSLAPDLPKARIRTATSHRYAGWSHCVRVCFPDVVRRLATEGRVRSGRVDLLQGCAWVVVLKRRKVQGKEDALSVDVQCEPTEASAARAGWRVCDGGMSFSLVCMQNRSRSLWRRWHRYGEEDRQPWSQNRSAYGWSHFTDADYVLNEANGFLFEQSLFMDVRVPVYVQLESPIPAPASFPVH